MSKDGNNYAIGDTFYSRCRNARIVYHPDWDAERPWVSYINGTASLHYAYAHYAMIRIRLDRGYTIDLTRQAEPA